jgi:hypothetical protein
MPSASREILALFLALVLQWSRPAWWDIQVAGNCSVERKVRRPAVGLFLASQYHVSYSVLELARLRTDVERKTDLTCSYKTFVSRLVEFQHSHPMTLFVARDVCRDLVRPVEAQPPRGGSPRDDEAEG